MKYDLVIVTHNVQVQMRIEGFERGGDVLDGSCCECFANLHRKSCEHIEPNGENIPDGSTGSEAVAGFALAAAASKRIAIWWVEEAVLNCD